ncbi:MAG: hypothetical protein AAF221_05355 [Pseudomonadota bacterium]
MAIRGIVLVFLMLLMPSWALAQPSPLEAPIVKPERAQLSEESKALQETLTNIIDGEVRVRRDIAAIRRRLRFTQDRILQDELNAQLADRRAELQTLNSRLEELATGIPPEEINVPARPAFNLDEEIDQLLEPFVSMMKVATEEARQIERLRQLKRVTEEREELAQRAIAGIQSLLAQTEAQAARKRLRILLTNWEERLTAARDLKIATQRQLETRLKTGGRGSASGKAIGNFVSTRGRNLFIGVLVFIGVILVTRIIAYLGHRFLVRLHGPDHPRSFSRRLLRLVFNVGSVIIACVSMLLVFDYFNDWLMFGLFIIAFVAGIWYALKALPSILQQASLLLNLGAVQEGEVIIFKDVPYLVKKLDYYTTLVNPKLRGGSFTVPVTELQGYHSRPLARDEMWFPCDEGDVVILSDERWGRITFVSPERVVMKDDGGSDNVFTMDEFLSLSPRNMSQGYRTECQFGVDYKHQAIATSDIPKQMAKDVRVYIERRFGRDNVRNVAVEFIEAGDSSLIYEVEADMKAAAAWRWEEVRFELAKAAVDSCTKNGWNIPFPHLSIHKLN